ncbi:MAG TPA: pantetheine-phosphate adenylyltransferase [Candidatus Kapabacteria bacterium]
MSIRRAIYPGTFDPITFGHLDVLARAAETFDEVVVAVSTASGKSPLFSESERRATVEQAIAEVLPNQTNITVENFTGLLVDYAKAKNATAIVRGLRALSDFEYEFQMALMNRKLADITTVFLMPHERYTYLNSTIVRELAKYNGDITSFVPKCVIDALNNKS